MAPKHSYEEIQHKDVERFIDEQSDFLFELRVLDKLRDLSFTCEHSGTYEDPVSKKVREFDIIATADEGKLTIGLSVECKNLKKIFPLVVHCTRRNEIEAYNEIVDIKEQGIDPLQNAFVNSASAIRLGGRASMYKSGFVVGKSTDQIYITDDNNDKGSKRILCKSDTEVFDKMSQAVNSSFKLIQNANRITVPSKIFICPVLVVPNETLWSAVYDPTEAHDCSVTSAKHISYYIGKTWETLESVPGLRLNYTLSHLEIVTIGYLEEFVSNFLSFQGVFFPY